MSWIEWTWTAMLSVALYRGVSFMAQTRYERAVLGDDDPELGLWMDEDKWYWRLYTAMVGVFLFAGIVSLSRPNPDNGASIVAYVLLTAVVILFAKGEVKAYYWRKRNGVPLVGSSLRSLLSRLWRVG